MTKVRRGSSGLGSRPAPARYVCADALDNGDTHASTVESGTTFDTTGPSVPVPSRCAPITSLFSRLTSAPVWVRVKNEMGMRCTWSNNDTRRS